MYIKIQRPTPYSEAEGKVRPINWLYVEATVFHHQMIPFKEVTEGLLLDAEYITDPADDEKPNDELHEVCMLVVEEPVRRVFLFTTDAYICSTQTGDTVERISPKRVGRRIDPDGSYLDEYGRVQMVNFKECPECAAKSGSPVLCDYCLQRREWMSRLAENNEPPCLKCAKKATRLVKDGVFIGTHCDDEAFKCGDQLFEDWEAPRVPRRSTANRKGAQGPNSVTANH
jgi:hypothetical protein